MDLKQLLLSFWDYRSKNKLELYNEFSFQHELGIYLRKQLPDYKVQFERNVKYFYPDSKTIKHEIDIVVFNNEEKYAVELKFPRNGQHPEVMYCFAEDLAFMEEVKELGFNKTFVMTLVDDPLFYSGSKCTGIYSFFRSNKKITGPITKPTGKKDNSVVIKGNYMIEWKKLDGDERYYLIEID